MSSSVAELVAENLLTARSLPIRAVRCLSAAFVAGHEAVGELSLLTGDAVLNVEQVVMHVSQAAVREVANRGMLNVLNAMQCQMDSLQVQCRNVRADGTKDFHVSLVYCALSFAGQLTLSSAGAAEPSLLYLLTMHAGKVHVLLVLRSFTRSLNTFRCFTCKCGRDATFEEMPLR